MRNPITLTALALATLGLAACDMQQTEEGEMPDVDVSVEEGNLPEYEVDGPEVKAGTTEMEVEVPVVDIEPGDVDEDEAEGE